MTGSHQGGIEKAGARRDRRPRWALAAIVGIGPILLGHHELLAADAADAAKGGAGAPKDYAAFRVVVDPRVELVSILFRLAGNPEYGHGRVDSYTRDVETHFSAFRNHKAVQVVQRLRQSRGVSYDAPMAMAVHLSDAEILQIKVPLDPWPASLDSRWTAEGVREFVDAARQFVHEASFGEFHRKHRPLYEIAESRMRALLEKEGHLEWFVKFFNEYADKFDRERKALEARQPKVASMVPANGATSVDPGLAKIVVVFDRPMKDLAWSMVGGGPHFPEPTGKPSYDAKRTTWSAPVKLKADWSYEFMLNAGRFNAFQSEEGVPLGPVRATFETAKAEKPTVEREKRKTENETRTASGVRYALVLCGHPGDKEHEEMYAEAVAKLREGLVHRWGFRAENVAVWFGGRRETGGTGRDSGGGIRNESMSGKTGGEQQNIESGSSAPHPSILIPSSRGPATREAIQAGAEEVRRKLKPEDTLWVIVIGHAHFDGRRAFFNLPGPDMDVEQFGKLWQGLAAREQVFWITTPVSGYAIKHLSQKGRVVITATEADREVNETIFPLVLADVIAAPRPLEELDRDKDGRVTLFDLYLTVSREVLRRYADEKNIPTEHAQLDDNGDGRGSEVQLDYLEEELGGRAKGDSRPKIKPGADGSLAASIVLDLLPAGKPGGTIEAKGDKR